MNLRLYGASLAALALEAAKAAGDALLTTLDAAAPIIAEHATSVAIADFIDCVPISYRTEVSVLLKPETVAVQAALDAGLVDRIHTGIAIAHATLDARIGALQATLTASNATPIAAVVSTKTVTTSETVVAAVPTSPLDIKTAISDGA